MQQVYFRRIGVIPGLGRVLLLLVTLDRPQAGLAMAYREICDFSASLCREQDWVA